MVAAVGAIDAGVVVAVAAAESAYACVADVAVAIAFEVSALTKTQ